MSGVLKLEMSPNVLRGDLPFFKVNSTRENIRYVEVGLRDDGIPIWADADVLEDRKRDLLEATRMPDEQ